MIVKLLTDHHFESLSFKGGCTGSSESTLVKMPRCWKMIIHSFTCNVIHLNCSGRSEYDQAGNTLQINTRLRVEETQDNNSH